MADTPTNPATSADVAQQLRELLHRFEADPSSYLAQLELRLEATRRPELRAASAAHRDLGDLIEDVTEAIAPDPT